MSIFDRQPKAFKASPESNDNEALAGMSEEEAQHEAELIQAKLAERGITKKIDSYDYARASEALDRLRALAVDEPELITAISRAGKGLGVAAYAAGVVPITAIAILGIVAANGGPLEANPTYRPGGEPRTLNPAGDILKEYLAHIDTAAQKLARLEKAAKTSEDQKKVYSEQYGEAA